jgi:hypothetical protein
VLVALVYGLVAVVVAATAVAVAAVALAMGWASTQRVAHAGFCQPVGMYASPV